jgi:hypothetical protein
LVEQLVVDPRLHEPRPVQLNTIGRLQPEIYLHAQNVAPLQRTLPFPVTLQRSVHKRGAGDHRPTSQSVPDEARRAASRVAIPRGRVWSRPTRCAYVLGRTGAPCVNISCKRFETRCWAGCAREVSCRTHRGGRRLAHNRARRAATVVELKQGRHAAPGLGHSTVARLQSRLLSPASIEQAKGVLMARSVVAPKRPSTFYGEPRSERTAPWAATEGEGSPSPPPSARSPGSRPSGRQDCATGKQHMGEASPCPSCSTSRQPDSPVPRP